MIDEETLPDDQDVFYSTGVPAIDQRLGFEMGEIQGIPSGSIILIHAPAATNLGALFAQRLLINLIEQNENSQAFYMHSSRPKHVVLKEFKAYNWDVSTLEENGQWHFIDMWTITSSHVASSSKIGKIDLKRKVFMKQVFNRMIQSKELENKTSFSVVDNLLWLKEEDFDRNSPKLLEYFKELIDLVVEIGGIHFFVLPKGILAETAERLIMSLVNGIVDFTREMEGNKNQDKLSIIKMTGVNYKSDILDITPDSSSGLRIESTGKL